jgi:hypothetical protein
MLDLYQLSKNAVPSITSAGSSIPLVLQIERLEKTHLKQTVNDNKAVTLALTQCSNALTLGLW